MSTEELRSTFLCNGLFSPGEIQLRLVVDLDRAVLGSATPTREPLTLPAPDAMRCQYFCERRELGVINLGGQGTVTIDGGEPIRLERTDVLYVGRGSREVAFGSDSPDAPAKFYLISFPAHADYPTTLAKKSDANRLELGSAKEANRRTIYQYIHADGVKSCQLVMGWTELAEGSVWNTMPPHTHDRRCEAYLYFDVADGHRVLHMMGEPGNTRPLWIGEGEAVLSPPWSIHCGCGTGSYSFVWGMGGENQEFADMDLAPIPTLR